MKVIQSTVERSLYILLIFIVVINMVIGYEVIHVQTVQNKNHSFTNHELSSIQMEMVCIGDFFAQSGQVRSTSSITTLKACQPIIKGTQ